MILVIVPMLPALANKVTPKRVHIPIGLSHLFTINWLYGFIASCVIYYVLNIIFPDRGTLIPSGVTGEVEIVEGVVSSQDSVDGGHNNAEKGLGGREPVEVVSTGVEKS
jgi:NCS1 family nucleobase:cation symporter-1